jgi:hypothetical protein
MQWQINGDKNTERENMKRLIQKIKDGFKFSFMSMAILIDESRTINEDGSWDKYNRRQNEKKMKESEK